jgi:hypothetical protein
MNIHPGIPSANIPYTQHQAQTESTAAYLPRAPSPRKTILLPYPLITHPPVATSPPLTTSPPTPHLTIQPPTPTSLLTQQHLQPSPPMKMRRPPPHFPPLLPHPPTSLLIRPPRLDPIPLDSSHHIPHPFFQLRTRRFCWGSSPTPISSSSAIPQRTKNSLPRVREEPRGPRGARSDVAGRDADGVGFQVGVGAEETGVFFFCGGFVVVGVFLGVAIAAAAAAGGADTDLLGFGGGGCAGGPGVRDVFWFWFWL